jgi:hypothetical protein
MGKRIPNIKHQILLSALLPAKLHMMAYSSMYIKKIFPDPSISPRAEAIRLSLSESANITNPLICFDVQALILRRQLHSFMNVISYFLESTVFDSLDLLDGNIKLESLLDESISEVSLALLDLASLLLLYFNENPTNIDMELSDLNEKLDSKSISILSLKLISIFCKYGLFIYKLIDRA